MEFGVSNFLKVASFCQEEPPQPYPLSRTLGTVDYPHSSFLMLLLNYLAYIRPAQSTVAGLARTLLRRTDKGLLD